MSAEFKKMTIEDLDLEFEDESEKEKGDGAIAQDVDFLIGAEESKVESTPAQAEAKVASLDAARTKKAENSTQVQSPTNTQPNVTKEQLQKIQNELENKNQKLIDDKLTALTQSFQSQMTQLTQSIQQLKAEVKSGAGHGSKVASNPSLGADQTKDSNTIEWEQKLAVSEFKGEYMAHQMSEFKLLEYKVNQYLLKIHAKNPNFQKEILAVKKLLQDHVEKIKKTGGS